MDINELKEYVDSKIKENGKQEITGPALNKVLNSTIDTLNDTASTATAEAVEKLESEITAEASAREQADATLSADVLRLKGIPVKSGEGGDRALVMNNRDANKANGDFATAKGDRTSASGASSSAEGASTTASGNNSHAEGASTTASGNNSHAEGDSTTASNRGAHAEGTNTSATAIASHAEGEGTIAGTRASHAEGKFNESDKNAIHTVGIGTSDTDRNNAEIIYTDGKKYVKGIGNYDGTKASITAGAKDVATIASEGVAHIADTSNPHKVTASQAGAATPAEVASAVSTHNTATDSHADIRETLDNCVKLAGEASQTVDGGITVDGPVSAKYITLSASAGYIGLSYMPSVKRISFRLGPATDVGFLAMMNDVPYINELTANIDTLSTAEIAPYYHNANETISGTLPDGVTSVDRFRLEVLPLGDNFVEQRLTVPTNGSVAVYTRVYDGRSWGNWV